MSEQIAVSAATHSGHRVPKSSFTRWSDPEIERLRELRAQNLARHEIADLMPGRSSDAIEQACFRFQIPAGAGLDARLLAMGNRTRSASWTDEQDQMLIASVKADVAPKMMALMVGRSKGAVISRLTRLRQQGNDIARGIGGKKAGEGAGSPRAERNVQMIRRKCLNCDSRFDASTRFLRMCCNCRRNS